MVYMEMYFNILLHLSIPNTDKLQNLWYFFTNDTVIKIKQE